MGLSRSAIRVLLHENKRAKLKGRILSLGRQDIFVTRPQLIEIMQEFGLKPVRHADRLLSRKESEGKREFISDEYLFQAMGFSECRSLDASSYEDADFIFDMNKAETPADLVNQWDIVLDGGAIEHIFHVPNVMANIFRMLKVGGRIIHMAPSSNHMDHGFYMFSPTFFWDYYMANGFDVNVCQIFRYKADWLTGVWEISDYIPGCLTRVSLGGLDNAIYGVILIATKTERSTFGVVPQQGMYEVGRWKGKFTVDEIAVELKASVSPDSAAPVETTDSADSALKGSVWQRLTWRRIVRSISFRINYRLKLVRIILDSIKHRIALRILDLLDDAPSAQQKGTGLLIRYRL